MKLQGNLHKMHTEAGSPVSYSLELGGQRLVLSDYLGERIRIEYLRQIECVHCGRITKKASARAIVIPVSPISRNATAAL